MAYLWKNEIKKKKENLVNKNGTLTEDDHEQLVKWYAFGVGCVHWYSSAAILRLCVQSANLIRLNLRRAIRG